MTRRSRSLLLSVDSISDQKVEAALYVAIERFAAAAAVVDLRILTAMRNHFEQPSPAERAVVVAIVALFAEEQLRF